MIFFKLISEKLPVMNANRTCLISTDQFHMHGMCSAICDLMEPMGFGQTTMNRLFRREQDASNTKLGLEFSGGDYRDLCYELETLILDVMHQRDWWIVFSLMPLKLKWKICARNLKKGCVKV